jgi:hypothetical protein
MEKILKLGEKEYRLHSSLFTIIDYRNVFSTELFSDIKKLDNSKAKKKKTYQQLLTQSSELFMYYIDLSVNNPTTTS